MPNTTPNLGLIKPLVTEQYDIAKVTNENADKIDLLLAPKANPTFTGTQTLPNIVTNGIKFPATQVPSADPNTLDDYEEGTFTPIIIGDTSAGVGTYTSQAGTYTKIGNSVTVQIELVWTAHTGTGNMRIGGLPFSVVGNGACSIGVFGQIPLPAGYFPTMHFSGSTIRFRYTATTGGTSQNLPMTPSSNGLIVGGTYLTS